MSSYDLIPLFDYKAWADAELLATFAEVPAEHAELLRQALRTLNHIHVVDRLFRARLDGDALPFEATNTPETPTLEHLRTAFAETDAWYRQYVRGLADDGLRDVLEFRFTDGDAGRMSRSEILQHVILHGAYHRGNVGQILKTVGLAPPRDLFTRFLHLAEPARRSQSPQT